MGSLFLKSKQPHVENGKAVEEGMYETVTLDSEDSCEREVGKEKLKI